MSDQTVLEVVLSSESVVGQPIIESVTVLGTVPIGPRGPAGADSTVPGPPGDPGPAGEGVPTGGMDAQVLAKASATDFDTEWVDIPAAEVTQAELDAEAALARNADNLTSGTVADARIASTIARDSEVSAAVAASEAGQVRDGDAAGGVLSGTYPNPGFAADMATQAELDAVSGTIPSTEAIQDLVGAMLTDSATVDFTYDDTAGTFTAVVQGLTSGSLSDFAEAVRDRLGATLVAGTGISVTVDDPGDTVTIATTVTQYTDEMARDAIGAALVAGTNITITPDDVANTITIDVTGGASYTDENAQDAVGGILADTATIDLTYTDATPSITADVKDGSITAAKVAADVATQAELDTVESDLATAIADGDASTLTSANAHADTGDAALVPKSLFDANTILKADSDNTPAALTMGASTILARLAAGNIVAATPAQLKTLLAIVAADVSDFDTQVAATAVLKSLFDANTILAATTDNTPAALTVGASTFVGRKASGNIAAMSVAEAVALLASTMAADSAFTGAFAPKAAKVCKVYRSSGLTVTTATPTIVDWNAEEIDPYGFHDNSTNPSRITIPTGESGIYMVGTAAGMVVVDTAGERFIMRMLKNGTEIAGSRHEGVSGGSASDEPGGSVSVPVSLAAGDYIQMDVFHQKGSDATLRTGTDGSAMWVVKLGT